ncbi:TerB family tellurite resistance protein [Vibrio japonicus]|uniref:TerB family tellurite resistance protein n=1 Tax=Vibrio japonicus TaxID=1824638 RepID=A0ABY5LJJ2_9VIBR|nr:TerB family tellurite resistance protein [Vibrio japonicus]UUM31571.1 TerB family tellurite resistance protein [Vibrio japonicus]
MVTAITKLFKQLLEGKDLGNQSTTDPNLAIACLLSEVAGADYQIDESEKVAKVHLLCRLLNLDEASAKALLSRAQDKNKESASLYDFTSQLRELSQETRFELIQAMWEVANADGKIDPLEDAVIRKTAELLYVDHQAFIQAKLAVIDKTKP